MNPLTHTVSLADKTFRPYLDNNTLRTRIAALGKELYAECKNEHWLFIGVLNGAFPFLTDLVQAIPDHTLEVGFVRYASYENMASTGKVRKFLGFDDLDLTGRSVVLVEDIVDTGLTLQHLLGELAGKHPKQVRVVSLLYKEEALQTGTPPDYFGFKIPNAFVVGYGLDYNGLGRNLPSIFVLNEA